MKISAMLGLGPKSEQWLAQINVCSAEDLRAKGAIRAFYELQQTELNPSLNMLYAMVGALEDKDWRQIAQEDRERLMFELEGLSSMEKMLFDGFSEDDG